MANIPIRFFGFEWDRGNKNKSVQKHGITCEESEEAFLGDAHVYPDTVHSTASEPRWVLLGETRAGRPVFIAFTIRGDRVRIISARPMSQKERNWYAEEKTKSHG